MFYSGPTIVGCPEQFRACTPSINRVPCVEWAFVDEAGDTRIRLSMARKLRVPLWGPRMRPLRRNKNAPGGVMDPLRELLATDHRQALEFFFLGLQDVSEPTVDRQELLYNASLLAHYAQVSTQAHTAW